MPRLSRRSFLASAPLVTTAALRGQEAPSNKITLGFIGVGTMGRGHLGGFLGRREVEVVAVCDVVKERLDSARTMVETRYSDRLKSGQYRGVRAVADFREVLATPGLDAVVIATPDHWHAMPAILAARAGKHIYCEKPLTQNLAEGRQLVDEVAKAKVIFQTGSQQRSEFGGHFRKAVEYVWNGRIGKLHTVRIGVGEPAVRCDLPAEQKPEGTDWDAWLGPAPERPYNSVLCPRGVHQGFPAWRRFQEYAGGQLADMGAHHFDIAQWAMRMDGAGPVEVIPPENPKAVRGLRFVYPNGVTMIHNEFARGADGMEIKADCVFEGSDGMILVSRGGISSRPGSILERPLGADAQKVYAASSHHGNWLECVRAKKETICPAEVGHRSASICHLGNIGYRLNRKLTWDAKAERFVNDAAANRELSREPRAKWKLV
ncbi:MAG: Gfo/Idh/MocA family oxidoreductase [Gemmataceae bacterium]